MPISRLSDTIKQLSIMSLSLSVLLITGCSVSDPEQALRLLQESTSQSGAEKLQTLQQAERIDNSNPEIIATLAETAQELGEYVLADQAYQQLIGLEGNKVAGLQGRIATALIQGDEAGVSQIIEAYPGQITPEIMVLVGDAHYSYSYFLSAADRYEQAITAEPTLVSAWTNMGVVQADLGELEFARQFMQEAVRLDPDNTLTQLNLATILGDIAYTNREEGLETTIYVSQALEILDELLAQDPDNLEARLYQGLILHENLQYEESIPPLQTVIEEEFSLQLASLTLARSYRELGQYDQAEDVLLEYLLIDADDQQIQQELIELELLRE